MSTVKISDLTAAASTDITNVSDVIIINDGSTTKKITVNNFIAAAGTSIKGNLIPSSSDTENTSSFELGSATSAWKELYVSTASINFVDSSGAITKFTKADVVNLKSGKSLRIDNKQIANEVDDTTYVRMGVAGKAFHYASDIPLIRLQTSSFALGHPTVPLVLEGTSLSMTGSVETSGSFENTGSFNTTGSFNVNNLLDLLANFDQTGIPTGSGEGGVAVGDINLDGQVNVNDLLLLLAGYGNPNQICNNQTIPPNVNHQFVGPVISMCVGSTLSISTGSFCSITF